MMMMMKIDKVKVMWSELQKYKNYMKVWSSQSSSKFLRDSKSTTPLPPIILIGDFQWDSNGTHGLCNIKITKKCSALPTELWGTSSLGAGRFVEFIFTFERNETMNEDGDATSEMQTNFNEDSNHCSCKLEKPSPSFCVIFFKYGFKKNFLLHK